ncbi:uncharacterized protein SPAPADRAFT_132639 [Spathaspora passalidarum NRRL Y-27907]|uniref:Uncharacterized protein n=1 Tax=Spathaspora passalidarum (strain NRRL Y-27907 / 11-Y1) TaxID=619300 RepID=G3AGA9_SPAPN|nr:uncharacterized protein SPAPADRAFT_132639 [Spathaspora passalidarum NRRL Y-27907]EGW35248.1 hypothetical protein SPAPADRAFT_132639 [Spathaspora passalidarum NRRL Y-27907]
MYRLLARQSSIRISLLLKTTSIRYYGSNTNNKSFFKSAAKGFNIFRNIESQEFQEEYQKTAKTEPLTDQLMKAIGNKKEPLYLLALFHSECKKMGIVPDAPELRNVPSWKFAFNYVFKLNPIHRTFWEISRRLDVSHIHHTLYYDVHNLGILDPRNFPAELYNELQTGIYNGLDFRNVQLSVNIHPQWTEKKNT